MPTGARVIVGGWSWFLVPVIVGGCQISSRGRGCLHWLTMAGRSIVGGRALDGWRGGVAPSLAVPGFCHRWRLSGSAAGRRLSSLVNDGGALHRRRSCWFLVPVIVGGRQDQQQGRGCLHWLTMAWRSSGEVDKINGIRWTKRAPLAYLRAKAPAGCGWAAVVWRRSRLSYQHITFVLGSWLST